MAYAGDEFDDAEGAGLRAGAEEPLRVRLDEAAAAPAAAVAAVTAAASLAIRVSLAAHVDAIAHTPAVLNTGGARHRLEGSGGGGARGASNTPAAVAAIAEVVVVNIAGEFATAAAAAALKSTSASKSRCVAPAPGGSTSARRHLMSRRRISRAMTSNSAPCHFAQREGMYLNGSTSSGEQQRTINSRRSQTRPSLEAAEGHSGKIKNRRRQASPVS